MDSFFLGNRVTNITNGRIENINTSGGATYVTVSYSSCIGCIRNTQTVVLVVGSAARIFGADGTQIPVSFLRIGMTVDASFSSVMTRSNPPQATAYMIRVVNPNFSESTTTGIIINIDRRNRTFSTISNGNPISLIQFNVPNNARIFDRFGRPVDFNALRQGMRVTVRHALFMTASIPPQTTAFEVQIR